MELSQDFTGLSERVLGDPYGTSYGGWITKEIGGPFKGAPGTGGW
jgi:hypothetical protein